MQFLKKRQLFTVSSLAFAVAAGNAVAGGFEKATLWDAEYSALAGAAVSSVNNSSAIFYNPAGLAFAESNDIALHVSPTVTQTGGMIEEDRYELGEKNFVPSGGFTGAYRLNEKFTLGYGVYASGGSSSKYEDMTVGGQFTSVTGDYSTDIKVIEFGLGLGYRINNNWSVGGTYRMTYAYADINMLATQNGVGLKVGYNDMSGFNYFGVRLGAMYRSDDDRLGWGVNYRSDVSVQADGKASFSSGAPFIPQIPDDYEGKNATAKTALPTQISTGFDYLIAPDWKLFGEITYSNYSANESITFVSDDYDDLQADFLDIQWQDQINYRIAAQYTGFEGWALRAGYIYTTAVTPEDRAVPTFSTPAGAHTFAVGAGTSFMDDKLKLDMTFEYNRAKITDADGGQKVGATPSVGGQYDSKAWVAHGTVRYMF